MTSLSRRDLLAGGLGLSISAGLAACSSPNSSSGAPSALLGPPTGAAPSPGQRVVEQSLTARPLTLDLGGRQVATWAYGDRVPGPLLRATAGDFLRVTLQNELPAPTTIHWHGIRLRNEADGVPGLTQDPVESGGRFIYEFTAPDPGTYFFHPHVGVQLDRGLYAPLVIDDPDEPGDYDAEWIVVLDDWIDGTGATPDEVLEQLITDGGDDSSGMGGMGHGSMGGMGMGDPPWGDAGDVIYPHFLINGRTPADPEVLNAKPGQRVRLRIISAASDTIFTVALGGHRMTLTHSDGFAVEPVEAEAFYIGMGERYDATVTLRDGVFPWWPAPSARPAADRPWRWSAPAPAAHPQPTSPRASWTGRPSSARSCSRPRRPGCPSAHPTRPTMWCCRGRCARTGGASTVPRSGRTSR